MREKIARMMQGRNGNDNFNNFIFVAALVLILLSAFISGTVGKVLDALALAALAYSYFRMFSKNIYKRTQENIAYLKYRGKVTSRLKLLRQRWVQRRDYRFYTCKCCKATLRVPRGKGKVNVVCRQCGNSFTAKT